MLTVQQIPLRTDNYSYALINDQDALIIDPSEEAGLRAFFAEHNHLTVKAVLVTHWHADHVGGNAYLRQTFQCPIIGPKQERDRIPYITDIVEHNARLDLVGITLSVHDVHAHTAGHLAYYAHAPVAALIKHGHAHAPVKQKVDAEGVVFVGDSLFAAGCGRLFEGTPRDLVAALQWYRSLPSSVLMACAHEYTKNNLLFAKYMLPEHQGIAHRLAELDLVLAQEGSSVPCSFGLEQATNPFLLALSDPEKLYLSRRLSCDSSNLVDLIGALRLAKDQF